MRESEGEGESESESENEILHEESDLSNPKDSFGKDSFGETKIVFRVKDHSKFLPPQTPPELKKTPAVVWLRARAFDPAPPKSGDTAAVNQIPVTLEPAKTKIIERKSESTGEAKLEDAQIIISGGRGLGGPEPFEDLKALAAVIGAQVAASLAACDSGWCPPTWQVGQTGKKVAPQLYLAVALSGASQHLAGMSDSKVVAAINTDKDAPIFKHCKFGIVEDYKKVIPLLKEKLAAAK